MECNICAEKLHLKKEKILIVNIAISVLVKNVGKNGSSVNLLLIV